MPNKKPDVIDIPGPTTTAIEPVTSDALTLTRAEVDMQISTAKKYPRDIARFEKNAEDMVERHMAMTKDPKDGLVYALTRGGKLIEGPNVRLAEIIAHTYGNCRVGARSVGEDESGRFVISEGVFHDLETNTAIRMYTKRRITDKEGRRYVDDMVGTTENAASGVAYRNVVLKGIPKVLWWPLYTKARKLAGGTTKTDTSDRRQKALDVCKKYNIPEDAVCAKLGVKKVSEIDSEKTATLVAILTSIAHQETTIFREFGVGKDANGARESKLKEKESAGNSDVIEKNQVRDVYVFMSDSHIESTDLRKALNAVDHREKLDTLPKSKWKQFWAELEKYRK